MARRRRAVVGIIVLLLAGVAINVAVAWGCAWRYLTQAVSTPPRALGPGEVRSWFWKPPKKLPVTHVSERGGFGATLQERYFMASHAPLSSDSEPLETTQAQQRFHAGWPWPSFRWSDFYDGGPPRRLTALIDAGSVKFVSWERGILVLVGPTQHVPYRHGVWLPVMPSGLGFVGDTLVYAGAARIVWLLLADVPRAWRRRRRGRQGLCPACGYGLAGLGRCPECGGLVVPETA